jgi:hypothetical protein
MISLNNRDGIHRTGNHAVKAAETLILVFQFWKFIVSPFPALERAVTYTEPATGTRILIYRHNTHVNMFRSKNLFYLF